MPPQKSGSPGRKKSEGSASDNERRQEYVKFISTKERKVCDDGFVDSRRYRSSYGDKTEDQSKRPVSVVDIAVRSEEEQKEYDKRLKIIEELMWRHKQEARELHQDSGSIVKKQREIRRTLRDYENSINQKRLEEDRKLQDEMTKYTALQQKREHEKNELGRRRLVADQTDEKEFKDQDHKSRKQTLDVERQYETKMAALELKHAELDQLNKEYEAKIQSKEEEQFKLKQELADLAVVLNMEAVKAQTNEEDYETKTKSTKHQRVVDDRNAEEDMKKKLSLSANDTKAAESARRKLSLDLTAKSARLEAKFREESRRKIDNERRMQENKEEQRRLKESARATETELQSRGINQRIQEHSRRKAEAQDSWLRNRQDKHESDTATYSEKFSQRYREEVRRKHEDHLNHFQKAVQKGEQMENELYHKLKEAEQASQQLEQSVRKSELNLMEVRRSNAARIKEEMTEMSKQESEMEQSLLRERAVLAKTHACRDESYQELQRQRERLRHDRFLLAEHEREHNRLTRVGRRTDAITPFN